ncbi:MAG: thiamine phosphate synthase [Bacteroidales bacterium]|jgi:thiamine-phosphate pyrophosphorylase
MDFDLSLYLVTDRYLSKGRPIEWIVEEAVRGGVTMVQLREKDCSTREFIELAIRLRQKLAPLKVPLIINDRADVALAADADGLHIGQKDMPYDKARRLLGREKIIGLSVENIELVHEANNLDVDYIGISPVFITATKTDTSEPFGLEGIKQVMLLSRHPAVAIGGINNENATAIIQAGANGIAVVSAICSADNPREAASKLNKLIANAKLKNQ